MLLKAALLCRGVFFAVTPPLLVASDIVHGELEKGWEPRNGGWQLVLTFPAAFEGVACCFFIFGGGGTSCHEKYGCRASGRLGADYWKRACCSQTS